MYQEKRPTCVTVIGWTWIIYGGFMFLSAPLSIYFLVKSSEILQTLKHPPPISDTTFLFRYVTLTATIQIFMGIIGLVSGINFLKLKAWSRNVLEIFSWIMFLFTVGNGIYMTYFSPMALDYSVQQSDITREIVSIAFTVLYAGFFCIMVKYLRGVEVKNAIAGKAKPIIEEPTAEFSSVQGKEKSSSAGKKLKVILPVILLLALVVLATLFFFFKKLNNNNAAVVEIQKSPPQSEVVTGQVKLQDVRQRILNNNILGKIRIVEGTAINQADFPISRIRIKGEIVDVDAGAVVLSERASFAGNILTADELATLSEEKILRILAQPSGRNNSNDKILPNGHIPFMIVFTHEPPGLIKTNLTTIGAERLLSEITPLENGLSCKDTPKPYKIISQLLEDKIISKTDLGYDSIAYFKVIKPLYVWGFKVEYVYGHDEEVNEPLYSKVFARAPGTSPGHFIGVIVNEQSNSVKEKLTNFNFKKMDIQYSKEDNGIPAGTHINCSSR